MTSKIALIAVALLLVVSQHSTCHAAAPNERISNFALTLRVSLSEIDEMTENLQSLIAFGKERNMTASLMMFLRTALDKVTVSAEELAKAEAAQQQKDLQAKGPAVFTNATVAVKPLKAASAEKKKRGNIPVYTVKEFVEKMGKKKIDDEKPFLITDGVNDLEMLKSAWSASELLKDESVEIRYVSPVVAKRKRSFEQEQQNAPEEEVYESTVITFEKYFRNCFNHKSKPDFKKVPGSDTEHCEQILPASLVTPNMTKYELKAIASTWGWVHHLEEGRRLFAERAADLTPLVGDGVDVKTQLAKSDSRFVVLGPAGSGDQLRKEKHSFVDGLVNGKRRWFFMNPEKFSKLREIARDTLEAASAFMFFEQQLGELKEEHGLGGKGLEFFETVQLPGDVLFVPGNIIKTGLALEDSVSYKQHIVGSKLDAVDYISSGLWAPETGVIPNGYLASVCYGFSFGIVPLGPQLNPAQAAIVEQILKQYYATPKAENLLIISVLDKCSRQLASPSLRLDQLTPCDIVWAPCVERLKANAGKLGTTPPSWLPATVEGAKKKKSEL